MPRASHAYTNESHPHELEKKPETQLHGTLLRRAPHCHRMPGFNKLTSSAEASGLNGTRRSFLLARAWKDHANGYWRELVQVDSKPLSSNLACS